jgi:CheY-like chemotaxis protein
VLLVDDEADIRVVAQMSLAEVGGWRTLLAASGAAAIELARDERPDLILLDVMMPEMDGVATFAALAADPRTEEIPVIFMTAKVQGRERGRYLGLGARGVIAKPFDPMTLPEEISEILSRAAPPADQPRPGDRLAALRAGYAQRLEDKLDALREAVDAARRAARGERRTKLAHAERMAHTLLGTAGSYGHVELSGRLEAVEAALATLGAADPQTEPGSEPWRQLDAALARVRAESD